MATTKRTFKCTGCGEDRPCSVSIVSIDDINPVESLECILDTTNKTSYNWVETTETRKLTVDALLKELTD